MNFDGVDLPVPITEIPRLEKQDEMVMFLDLSKVLGFLSTTAKNDFKFMMTYLVYLTIEKNLFGRWKLDMIEYPYNSNLPDGHYRALCVQR